MSSKASKTVNKKAVSAPSLPTKANVVHAPVAAAVKAVIAAVEEQEVGFKSLHSTPLHNLKY